MPSKLTFDNAVINGTTIATDEFVHGSGSLQLKGSDTSTTTADGRIHNDRRAIVPSTSIEVYGDKTSVENGTGLSVPVTLKRDTAAVKTFSAQVTAKYSGNSNTTSIDLSGDPETS